MKHESSPLALSSSFRVSQGAGTGLNSGILLGCKYADCGGTYLLDCETSPTAADFGVRPVPTWVIDDINFN